MLWPEDVVTLKMLLCQRCCDVEDVFTLKMLKMLLCWRCCYVEDVATLKMFLRWRCKTCCHVEKGMCISPMVVGDYCILMGFMTTLKFYQHAILPFSTKTTQITNLKNLKLVKTADNIPQLCCPACWRRSMRYRVPWRPQNAVKRSEKWHFQIFLQLHFNCVRGAFKPLSLLYIHMHMHKHTRAAMSTGIRFMIVKTWPSARTDGFTVSISRRAVRRLRILETGDLITANALKLLWLWVLLVHSAGWQCRRILVAYAWVDVWFYWGTARSAKKARWLGELYWTSETCERPKSTKLRQLQQTQQVQQAPYQTWIHMMDRL